MKSRIVRHTTKATLFAAMLLTACLCGSAANAQSAVINGKFTLQHETRWGQAMLPAGDYQLTIDDNQGFETLVLCDARSHRQIAIEFAGVREGSSKGASALLIGRQGTQRVVYSLTIAELGETFVYKRPPAQAPPIEEAGQAGQTQAVAVLVTKK